MRLLLTSPCYNIAIILNIMNKVLFDELEKFHCGERFKELCIAKKKESPTEWAKILKLAHRNMVHYRWKSANIAANELYIICNELGVTIDEFFKLEKETKSIAGESVVTYKKKPYIEDQIDDLQKRLIALEKLHKDSQI